ncbi:tetrathionate reductase family octaheme c-type cytochrome [Ferrimonas gelatinilytica]|uniref:Tetrathionate reductase family octaheme c-type cytochrome n=1 Tax=Ferrimonas gelatinilytica TaxID=1255257 RepID=A0ABP9SAD0_9GAMM
MKAILLPLMLGLLAGPAGAANPHAEYIDGPITSGPEATAQCLACHEEHAKDFIQSSHWTWSLEQQLPGRLVDRGKRNTLNNFCTAISGNEPRCTSCHAGYGWKDNNFDFTNTALVDCLVCHDTTGTYVKDPEGAGAPLAKVNLLRVAQNVGAPVRDNCGSCHFYGGGGDGVKHGDLDSSMGYPDRQTDVHMDVDGLDFQCQACHDAPKHQIAGQAMGVSPGGQNHFGCERCHDAAPHNNAKLDRHVAAVACQTCHIPYFAKNEPTKMVWDWSTAGQNREETLDQFGRKNYQRKKGDFVWDTMVKPEYAWYNGNGDAYVIGDKMDPTQVTKLAFPLGDIRDSKAKLYPFKVHRGEQIYDAGHNIFVTAKVWGEGGYWTTFDWDQAARLGMEANPELKKLGLGYSGKYGFAPTEMWWRLNHMVAPKEDALGCMECHGKGTRLDWTALGYPGDPMKVGGRASTRP